MRIALVAFGTRGDVQPLVALGLRLRADGHEVVVGASRVFAESVRGRGLEFQTVGGDIESFLRDHADALVMHPERSIKPVVNEMIEEIDVSFAQTHELARGADLLISGIHPASRSIAEALDLPHRTLLYCPQMLRSLHHPPPGVPWFSLPRICNRLLWGTLAHGLDVWLGEAVNHQRRRLGLEPIAGVADSLCAEHIIVASDGLLGGLPPDAPHGVEQTGALVLHEEGALDPALERFLEHGEPPIYVGFGSMPDRDPRGTTLKIVEALTAVGRRAVIVSGWAGLGSEGVPPGIFVARSAPHALLLPRVAIAVHHGGAGTTAAAARAGIPQIVVPHAADQFYWGEQIHRRGLGSRPIPRNTLTSRKLARAIQSVLSLPRIAERAHEVGAALARTDGVSALTGLLYRSLPDSSTVRRAA